MSAGPAAVSAAISARDRLTDFAYVAGWRLVRWLPEPVAAQAFTALADVAWRRRIKGVAQLERNLRRVVGQQVPESALHDLSRAALRSYFRYWMEVFRLPSWSPERIVATVRVEHEDRLRTAYASGDGLVCALPHCANWDLAGAWAVTTGLRLTTVAERLKPESLYDRFVAYRESLGMEVLPLTGDSTTYRVLIERLRAGGLVCLVADRDLSASGIPVRFFGETATMPAGPAALVRATGATLLPVTLWYEGELVLHIGEPVPVPAGSREEQVAAMTQHVADVFETGIRQHPEDWHMLQPLWVADRTSRRRQESRI